jgi:hypothetical protein
MRTFKIIAHERTLLLYMKLPLGVVYEKQSSFTLGPQRVKHFYIHIRTRCILFMRSWFESH